MNTRPQSAAPGHEGKRFVPYIHNYCDRWCERCPLTSRCSVFAVEQRVEQGQLIDDALNALFWSELERNSGAADAPLTDEGDLFSDLPWDVGAFDGDDDDAVEDDAPDIMDALREAQADEHPCIRYSKRYLDLVAAWLKATGSQDEARVEELQKRAPIATQHPTGSPAYGRYPDLLEVLNRYRLTIHVKFRRAFQGRLIEEEYSGEVFDEVPLDSDGSAKVALICIDRSIAAWLSLHQLCPESEDTVVRMLMLLNALRSHGEQEFPRARLFVRPGFDDEAA